MRAPRFAQPGEPGEEKNLRLELKILADAGLLGLPNAGKSTFISRVSAARPKIAAYPFTTLTPNLGVMIDEVDPDRRMVIADIPGLIEGAHEGQGLGLRFLKHVERTRFLVHILSVEDVGEDDPWAGFNLINEELRRFDAELGERQQIEVVNKIDLVSPEKLEELRARALEDGRNIFFISALEGLGLEPLVEELWKMRDMVGIMAGPGAKAAREMAVGKALPKAAAWQSCRCGVPGAVPPGRTCPLLQFPSPPRRARIFGANGLRRAYLRPRLFAVT